MKENRYKVEERSGIVAVYDTHHPDYHETPGCNGDYAWCIASWMGNYNTEKKFWVMEQSKIDKAYALAKKLNCEEIQENNIFPATIREDKIWDKFCNERCKLREKCMLELVDETECPIVTRIVELDYVKK